MEKKFDEIMSLDPYNYLGKKVDIKTILNWFDLCDAAWIHDGDSKKPHAELTSGKCSNAYFNCPEVLKFGPLNEILAYQLYQNLREAGATKVDWVIGSPYAAITFSYELAKLFKAIHGFTEKDPKDSEGKKMVWRRMVIPSGSSVLQVEELVSTSGTFQEVRRAVEKGNAEPVNFLPEIGVLIHRPPKLPVDYGDRRIVALVEKEVWAVESDECPLYKTGSPRCRPKSHWRELTGKV